MFTWCHQILIIVKSLTLTTTTTTSMGTELCPDAGLFDFRDPCVRASWTALLPALFVLTIIVFSIPIPAFLRNLFAFIRNPFEPFLTLQEAEFLETDTGARNENGEYSAGATKLHLQFWRTLVFAGVGLAQSLAWLAYGSFRLIVARPTATAYTLSLPFLLAFAWLYSLCRSVFRPSLTPPYDLFSLYCILFVGAVIQLGAVVYDHHVLDAAWPPLWVLAALTVNLGAVAAVQTVLLGMPVAVPSERVDKEEIVSYSSLFLYTRSLTLLFLGIFGQP